MAETMKNAAFWDLRHVALVTTDTRHIAFLRCMRRLLVTANAVPSSLILFTLMRETIYSSKMLVFTRATWHNIPEDGILQCIQNIHPSVHLHSIQRCTHYRSSNDFL
jgi:hypothetical protein